MLFSAFSFGEALTGEKLLIWQNIFSDKKFSYKKSFELHVSYFNLLYFSWKVQQIKDELKDEL